MHLVITRSPWKFPESGTSELSRIPIHFPSSSNNDTSTGRLCIHQISHTRIIIVTLFFLQTFRQGQIRQAGPHRVQVLPAILGLRSPRGGGGPGRTGLPLYTRHRRPQPVSSNFEFSWKLTLYSPTLVGPVNSCQSRIPQIMKLYS